MYSKSLKLEIMTLVSMTKPVIVWNSKRTFYSSKKIYLQLGWDFNDFLNVYLSWCMCFLLITQYLSQFCLVWWYGWLTGSLKQACFVKKWHFFTCKFNRLWLLLWLLWIWPYMTCYDGYFFYSFNSRIYFPQSKPRSNTYIIHTNTQCSGACVFYV